MFIIDYVIDSQKKKGVLICLDVIFNFSLTFFTNLHKFVTNIYSPSLRSSLTVCKKMFTLNIQGRPERVFPNNLGNLTNQSSVGSEYKGLAGPNP